jgi:hypothetical protein
MLALNVWRRQFRQITNAREGGKKRIMKNNSKAGKPADKKAEPLESAPSNPIKVVAPVKANSVQTADQGEALDAREQDLLAECETDIKENLPGAFVFGWRLEQIRGGRLYRATHKTFAEYCDKRWDFTKTHANRMIQAHTCRKHLQTIKGVEVYVPTKESQVRYIADLEPEQQVKVAHEVYEAVGDGEASAGDFGDARQKLYPKPKPAAKEHRPPKDAAGVPVKFDTNLVSFAEIKKRLQAISNICDNSAKKQEAINLINKLQRDLDAWADWQAKQLNQEEVA